MNKEQEQAAKVIAQVRERLAKSPFSTRGRRSQKINPIFSAERACAALSNRQGFDVKSYFTPLKNLMVKFITISERHKIPLDESALIEISAQLLEELKANVTAFSYETNPDKMVPLTLFHGANFIAAREEPEFKSLKENSPEIFKEATLRNYKNPRDFLRRFIKITEDLEKDPRFQDFSLWQLKHAAISNSVNAAAALLAAQVKFNEIMDDPEFKPLHSMPWIIRTAVVQLPRKSRDRLRKVINIGNKVKEDPKFEVFLSVQAVFFNAAAKNGTEEKTSKYLKNIISGKIKSEKWNPPNPRASGPRPRA